MDQQQATNYILERLKLGYTKVDIAADMSQRIGAPPDLVMRFVNKVADLQIQQEPSPDNEKIAHHDDQDAFEPTYDLIHEWDYNDQENSYVSNPDEKEISENIPGDSTHIGTAQPNQEKFKSKTAAFDRDALTDFVVQSTKRQRRFNDIVEMVCKRTGMTWNQAQRMVARTQTVHHKELTKSSGKIIIPVSIGFIIGGILLLIWSIVTIFDFYNAFMGQDFSALPVEFIFVVGGVFIASFGIMAGGAFGLYRTLSRH